MSKFSNTRLQRKYNKSKKRSHRRARLAIARALKGGEQLIEDEGGDGFVYIFDLGMDSLYKIGHSRNVDQRLYSFMVANPRLKLVLSVKVSDMVAAEGALHTQFATSRQQGELFRFTEEELAEVRSCFPSSRAAMAHERVTPSISTRVTVPDARDASAGKGKICTSCATPFVPEKDHWERCAACESKKHNKTVRGWARWRNLRGKTHVHTGERKEFKWGENT